MSQPIPWVFYVSEMGRAVYLKEQEQLKLSDREDIAVRKTLIRISEDSALHSDVTYLGRDIWEARVKLDKRVLRVLYFAELDPPCFVAVHVFVKKTQKTPHHMIELALSRRKQWLRLNKAGSNE